eukprot:1078250-Prymnesium_polylepis.2
MRARRRSPCSKRGSCRPPPPRKGYAPVAFAVTGRESCGSERRAPDARVPAPCGGACCWRRQRLDARWSRALDARAGTPRPHLGRSHEVGHLLGVAFHRIDRDHGRRVERPAVQRAVV